MLWPGVHVAQVIVQHVAKMRAIEQVMMRVDYREVGLEDRLVASLLDLVEWRYLAHVLLSLTLARHSFRLDV